MPLHFNSSPASVQERPEEANKILCRPQSVFFPLIKVRPQFLIMGIFTPKPKILRINKRVWNTAHLTHLNCKKPVVQNVRYSNGPPSRVTTIWIPDTHTVWYSDVWYSDGYCNDFRQHLQLLPHRARRLQSADVHVPARPERTVSNNTVARQQKNRKRMWRNRKQSRSRQLQWRKLHRLTNGNLTVMM